MESCVQSQHTRQCGCSNLSVRCARAQCVGFGPGGTALLQGEMCDKLALWGDAGSASLLASPTKGVLM